MRSFFPLLRYQRNLILPFSWYKTLCKTWKNLHEFHLYYWDHVCKVNQWCLVDCFYHKFRVSTKKIVCDYCIAKCKKFSTCWGYLMALWVIFFAIQYMCINSNPVNTLLYDQEYDTLCPDLNILSIEYLKIFFAYTYRIPLLQDLNWMCYVNLRICCTIKLCLTEKSYTRSTL